MALPLRMFGRGVGMMGLARPLMQQSTRAFTPLAKGWTGHAPQPIPRLLGQRFASSAPLPRRPARGSRYDSVNTDGLLYTLSLGIVLVGVTYAAVPLYRAFCGSTGLGGNPLTDASKFTRDKLVPVATAKRYRITFNSDVSGSLQWRFKPQQREIFVLPGETALSFFTATNVSDHDLIGISTYNVTPNKAGAYFNKVQCFCFEEQMLRAGESVDMPVFFFLDPEIADDPLMHDVDTITLSYTFFNARKA